VNDEQKKLVAEAKDYHAKSTKGDWTTDGGRIVTTSEPIVNDPYRADQDDRQCADVCEVLHPGADIFANGTAEAIAHAHNNMPALIAIIEEQEAAHQAERKLWRQYASAKAALDHGNLHGIPYAKQIALRDNAILALIDLDAWAIEPVASSSE
jgi:hypothetical protein